MNRIICTGDLHGDITRLFTLNEITKGTLTKNDLVIILGDFGVIWDENTTMRKLEALGQLPFTIAFLDGNHENFNLIKQMERIIEWNGARAGLLPCNIIHLLRGEIYEINNKRIGVCGGADSVDKWWRTEGKSWWADEQITDKDYDNFKTNLGGNKTIDIMLSHDCPKEIVPIVKLYSGVNDGAITNSQRQLARINFIADIKKWYFGHWHIDIPIDDKFQCMYHAMKEI